MNEDVGKSPAAVSVIANVEDKKFYYNKKLYYAGQGYSTSGVAS
jgi:hypothetical protein